MTVLNIPADFSTNRMMLVETFVRIVESGNLSAAARMLGTTQPTISRRLKALEQSMGVRLLQRSTHAIKLTEDGARCYQRAKELIEGWQAFESEVRGASDEPVGRLRVFMPHAFGQLQLVAPLVRYLERYSSMSVDWVLDDRLPNFVAEGIDCAVHVGEVQDPSVIAQKVGEIPRIVVAAPQLLRQAPVPVTPQEVNRLPWVALSTFYLDEVVLTHSATGQEARIPIRPRLSTNNMFALINVIKSGIGVGIASAWVLKEDLENGRLIQLIPQWQAKPIPVYLVYPPARFYPARLRRFIEIMREGVPQAFGISHVR